jgi:hypothetical protein
VLPAVPVLNSDRKTLLMDERPDWSLKSMLKLASELAKASTSSPYSGGSISGSEMCPLDSGGGNSAPTKGVWLEEGATVLSVHTFSYFP